MRGLETIGFHQSLSYCHLNFKQQQLQNRLEQATHSVLTVVIVHVQQQQPAAATRQRAAETPPSSMKMIDLPETVRSRGPGSSPWSRGTPVGRRMSR